MYYICVYVCICIHICESMYIMCICIYCIYVRICKYISLDTYIYTHNSYPCHNKLWLLHHHTLGSYRTCLQSHIYWALTMAALLASGLVGLRVHLPIAAHRLGLQHVYTFWRGAWTRLGGFLRGSWNSAHPLCGRITLLVLEAGATHEKQLRETISEVLSPIRSSYEAP